MPLGSFWGHVKAWWDIRERPNVLLVHFNRLKANLPREMRRIAAFLEIAVDDARWPAIVEHCTFECMKNNGDRLSVPVNDFFEGGIQASFIYKGTNGRWRHTLTPDEVEKYERLAVDRLTPDCARWLATGDLD